MRTYFDHRGFRVEPRGIPTTFDVDAPLHLMPHYSDDRFTQEQTVFGAEAPGLFYNYSDRLWQADPDKADAAAATANASGATRNTARWVSAYLSAYFDKPITVQHIVAGVNKSNGFPYCVYGYLP